MWGQIWDVLKDVLFGLLLVSIIVSIFIAGETLGVVAQIVIFIVSSWIILTLIKEAMMGNSEIKIKDFFKVGTIVFMFVAYVLMAIIYLYCLFIYHV